MDRQTDRHRHNKEAYKIYPQCIFNLLRSAWMNRCPQLVVKVKVAKHVLGSSLFQLPLFVPVVLLMLDLCLLLMKDYLQMH